MDLSKWNYGGQDTFSKLSWDNIYDRAIISRAANKNCLHHAMNAYIEKHPGDMPTTFPGMVNEVSFIREVYILSYDEMAELLREHEAIVRAAEARALDAVLKNWRREEM